MATTRTKIAAAERTLRVLRARQKRIDRRDETRRKILYGAAALNLLEAMPEPERARLLARIHAHVVRPTDREFLELPAQAVRTRAEPGAADVAPPRGKASPETVEDPGPEAKETAPLQGDLPLFA